MPDNVISITVRAQDATRAVFGGVNQATNRIGDNLRTSFGRANDAVQARFGQLTNQIRGSLGQSEADATRAAAEISGSLRDAADQAAADVRDADVGDGLRDSMDAAADDADDALDRVSADARRAAAEISDNLRDAFTDADTAVEQFRRNSVGRLIDLRGRYVAESRAASEEAERGTRSVFGRITDGFKAAWGAVSGFGEKLKGLGESVGEFMEGPHGTAVKIAAVLTLLPVLASTAAAAITVGLGAALLGIGIKAAAQSEQVKDAFKDMAEEVKNDLRLAAAPLEPVLVRAAERFGQAFDAIGPHLSRAFAGLAPVVDGFIDNVSQGFESWGPMIGYVAQEFAPLLDVLGSELQVLLEHLAARFTGLAEAADPRFLSMLISGFTGLIDVLLITIEYLARAGSSIAALVDKIPGIDFDDGASSARTFGEAVGEAALQSTRAGTATEILTKKVTELANQFLAASDAEIGFESAIDAATEAVKKNGRTLDINTEAGRNNRSALNAIASSALSMRDSMEEAGQDSSKAMQRARTQFIRAAEGMGLSRREAARLADQSGLLAQEIRKVPGQKKTTFSNNARQAAERVREVQQALAAIPRNITTTVNTRYSGKGGKATGGIIGGAATGGVRNDLTWVGEQGPELVRLPVGSTVYPAGQSQRMAAESAGDGAGRPIVVQLRLGTEQLGEVLIDPIRHVVRTFGGGDVQAAFGR